MSLASAAASLLRNGLEKAALVTAAVLVGCLGHAPASFAQPATSGPKEQIVLLYELQMAPTVCQWNDVGDASKLDAKVVEAEKELGITDDEKAKFEALAEADLRIPKSCDADGLARALYDEAVK
jgi:hypothetical protein